MQAMAQARSCTSRPSILQTRSALFLSLKVRRSRNRYSQQRCGLELEFAAEWRQAVWGHHDEPDAQKSLDNRGGTTCDFRRAQKPRKATIQHIELPCGSVTTAIRVSVF